jgi:hypothetical protein
LETLRVTVDANGKELEWPLFQVSLSNTERGYGLLFFSLFDQHGNPYDFEGSFAYHRDESRLNRSILDVIERLRAGRPSVQEPMTLQFQMLFSTESPFSEQAVLERRQKFLALREEAYAKSIPAIKEIR